MAKDPVPFFLGGNQSYSEKTVSVLLPWLLHGSGTVFGWDKSSGVTVLSSVITHSPCAPNCYIFFSVLFCDFSEPQVL